MARRMVSLLVVVLLGFASVLLADWNPDDPHKWVQYPDLTPLGIDVNASYELILADDFQCTQHGQINSIHIWGSWLWDDPPFRVHPDSVKFTLSFHADIPDTESTTGYSMPGDELWYREFLPGEFTVRIWSEGILEGWMEPLDSSYIFPADSICWQYNFYLWDGEFFQDGTPDQPITYWLNVKAEPLDPQAWFGWKTSRDHWNDDAVWGEGYEPYFGPWYELRYPMGHEQYGQSIDLAFVIVGEDVDQLDWGDAPDLPTVPGYPTLAIHNGANHIIGGPWLGDDTDSPDPEFDGQPDPNALGDDNDGNDDEDGVLIPVLVQGRPSTITMEVNGGGGSVVAWIDFDGNKVWTASEQIFAGWLADGIHSFNITTPAAAVVGQTFARFRISSVSPLPPDGPALIFLSDTPGDAGFDCSWKPGS